MQHTLPTLPYSYDALEPNFDAQTMEIHHSKHHQAYTDKMNTVLEKYPELTDSPEELMKNLESLKMSAEDKKAFKNNGGGYINHNMFWKSINPNNKPDKNLTDEINSTFGSFEEFKEKFNQTALTHFGSGWAWLVRNSDGQLEVYSTTNQDSPLSLGHEPIFCLDVWEHAYYLKYQNKRAEYIEQWWHVLKMV